MRPDRLPVRFRSAKIERNCVRTVFIDRFNRRRSANAPFCKRFGDARLGRREAEQPHELVVADIRTIIGIDNCENGFRHLKHIGM